jgi:hypothetical protein
MKASYQDLDLILQDRFKVLRERFQGVLDRRMQGPIAPSEDPLKINMGRFRKRYERISLFILSWYLGDLGFLIRLEGMSERDPAQWLCKESKATMLEYVQSHFSERDFFGNLLPTLERVGRLLKVYRRRPSRSKRVIRRRGYRDQGTLRPSHQRFDLQDAELTEEQNRIEAQRQSDEDTLQFLLGFAGLV